MIDNGQSIEELKQQLEELKMMREVQESLNSDLIDMYYSDSPEEDN